MKLRDTRLCTECEEVYKASGLYGRCPVCGSESYALVCRWVPTVREFERWVEEQKTMTATT